MKKYVKLMRITVWSTFLLGFAVGFGIGAVTTTSLESIVFGFLTFVSCMSFIFALNFYADVDVDRYHDGRQKDMDLSKQPLLTGEVTEKECMIFCALVFFATIIFGVLVNYLFGLLMFSVNLLGILYSHPWFRLKEKPLADVFCNSFAGGVLLLPAGYALTQATMPPWLVILWGCLIGVTFYIPTVISDYEFDLRAKLRTSAVVFGQRNLMNGMAVSCLISLPIASLITWGSYPLDFKILVIIGSIYALTSTIKVWKALKPPVLDVSPQWLLLPFNVISLLFICYGLSKIFLRIYL